MPKHFLPKDPNDLVNHCLKAYIYENDSLSLLEKEKVIFNNRHDSKKVSLISGGGSGHEPGWIGFVGSGMLTASAQGDIFASPNYKNIKSAEKATHSEAGTIFLITNYTGDNLYFGMAAQELISKFGESKIRLLRTTDDVAVSRTTGKLVGRRTLAGCIFIMKILGAASEKGYNIEQIYNLGISANKCIASVNAGLDHTHIPGHANNADYGKLEENQIEIGLGIHNEPGVMKTKSIPSNEELIPDLLKLILDKNDKDRGFLDYEDNDQFILLFNNLGGLPVIEEKALLYCTIKNLADSYNITPSRVYSGSYITSINAPIFTISLFNVTKAANTDFTELNIFDLFDAPTEATNFPKSHYVSSQILNPESRIIDNFQGYEELDESIDIQRDIMYDSSVLERIIRTAAQNIIDKEPEITDWDTKMGDGDCGTTLETGARAIIKSLDNGVAKSGSLRNVLHAILKVLKDDMGGTLGAILFIFMKAFINKLESNLNDNISSDNNDIIAIALDHGIDTLGEFTKAREGHRTVMDVLIPFCRSFSEYKNIHSAVEAARKAAEGTRRLRPKLGRATYVGGVSEKTEFPPDPGAYGVYEILAALSE
ncbi:DEHA2B12892p [Debaryomyces hansenii CBS767]|uniref:Dihydroxyacetone kinase n=1 Tax=Debaryomyces hansenii (strain ATCC 36239 / CBS 767 / BCRC 21394 / JCM 1990 / NBRC 0083 / IGC 2968) TaxID=284592 RepID=Q6BWB4_DEBHA|nr:DEHA2B12892p [Debaryomyces hansenii CBS767]CAG85511.2 DEHA2B12892p [Debaryomyces hansenii CBS767]|eukprot:XP_457505.2 DEHA2B12892p [Debaryomyces hansenii CBS767]